MRAVPAFAAVVLVSTLAAQGAPSDPAFVCKFRHPSHSVASLAQLPSPIRRYIAEHIGAMADRGQFFNSTDVVERPGPATRFIRGGEIGERWFLWYEHGGIAYWREIVLFGSDPSGAPHVIADKQARWNDNLCAQSDALLDGLH